MNDRATADAQIRERRWDVFISHARDDAGIARSLTRELQERGFSVWHDAQLGVGQPLQSTSEGIRSSGVFLFLLSPASLASPWQRREIDAAGALAFNEGVFLIAVGDIDSRHFPGWLADRQCLHLRHRRQVGSLVAHLIPRLHEALGRSRADLTTRVYGEPPSLVPLIGTGAYLRELQSRRSGVTCIAGQPGSGKSHLAREYAARVTDEVDFMCWLRGTGSDAVTLAAQVQAAASSPDATGLIVLDGVDEVSGDTTDLIRWIEELADHHRVVVTTRTSTGALHELANAGFPIVTLGPLQDEDIHTYLEAAAPELTLDDRARLSDLIRAFGSSPPLLKLAVEAVRKHAFDSTWTAAPTSELAHRLVEAALADLTPADQQRVRMLAYCADFLGVVRRSEHWALKNDQQLFARLLRSGICSEAPDGDVWMHAMVVDALRRSATRNDIGATISYVSSRLPDPGDAASKHFAPAIAALSELSEFTWDRESSAGLVELLIWQAARWRSASDLRRASQSCERARLLADDSADPELRIRTRNLQSALAFDAGHLDEAYAIEQETAQLAATKLGADHPTTLASMANLAVTLRGLGRLAEAAELLHRVVDQSQRQLPAGHPDLIAAYNNLGVSLREVGDYDGARHALTTALGMASTSSLRFQPAQTLAATLTDLGELDEARQLLETTVAAAVESGDPDGAEALTARTNLATVYWRMGRTDEAVAMQGDVVEDFEITLGPEHPSTLAALGHYAALLSNAGHHEEATRLWDRVADARAAALGPRHVDTLEARLMAARALCDVDESRARERFARLVPDTLDALGPRHPLSFLVREQFAELLLRAGELPRAKQAFDDLLVDMASVLPDDHPARLRVRDASERSR